MSISNIRTVLATGIGAYLVSIALLAHTNDAAAAYRRVHSSQCHYFYDDAGSDLYNGVYLLSGSSFHTVYCPAPSDSTLAHASTVTLNVHGYSPSAADASSVACAKAYNAPSYTCGTAKYWAAGYGGVYGVDVTAWSDGAAFPMVINYLTAGSQLYGFYMST